MLSKPRYNITTRSNPIPPPAWGGQPYLNASIYDLIFSMSTIKKNMLHYYCKHIKI